MNVTQTDRLLSPNDPQPGGNRDCCVIKYPGSQLHHPISVGCHHCLCHCCAGREILPLRSLSHEAVTHKQWLLSYSNISCQNLQLCQPLRLLLHSYL